MKTKQIVITLDGNANSLYIAVVTGENKNTGEKGFIVYGFNANQPKPLDTKEGRLLIDTLFETEAEALKAGEQIIKAKVKADYARIKKDVAKQKKK